MPGFGSCMHRHHIIMLGTFLCHLLYLPSMYLKQPCKQVPGVAFGTNPLSTENTNTCGYQECEFAKKNSKASPGKRQTSRERKQKENQVMLFSSGCNKTETSHRHVSLLPLQSMYKSVIEECIYYGSMYVCIFKVA